MIRSVLVAVDGSGHSWKALEFGCMLANGVGAGLHLLHVVVAAHENRTLVLGGAAITVHGRDDELREVGQRVIDAAQGLATARGCEVRSAQLAGGAPADAILARAAEVGADTIVMGSRGLGSVGALLLGSVSQRVAHAAPCSCVTVR